jgi:GNAT superfamily N-acetyltransferase
VGQSIGDKLHIVQEPLSALVEHSKTPIALDVDSVFDVVERQDGGFDLAIRLLAVPYMKDYDALEHPAEWTRRFDLSKWCLLGAYFGETRVGGAVIAFDMPEVQMLDGRSDLAVLWDLRVAPNWRRQGIGGALFAAAAEWARATGCTELKVETQNVNVPACRFYASQGCTLRTVSRGAYAALADEIQLLWYHNLR